MCSAISAVVGDRPSLPVSAGIARLTCIRRSWTDARHAQHPSAVAEMALDLAEDRRDREARERGATVELVAVDRLHEPEARDLDQIVH